MQLLDAILELAFPTRCAGCELPGEVICPTCEDSLPRVDSGTACPRCGAPYGALVCTECWDTQWAFEAALALGELEAPLARMVVLHKDAGEQRLGPLLGTLLAEKIASEWPGWADAVTYVPATREAKLRRGFDHGRAFGHAVAERLGVPLVAALARGRTLDQRALGRAGRAHNAAGSFSAVGDVAGRLLLCDDVFTTGATLDAAAEVLLAAGAAHVRCAAVARAW
jgi:predicted amidophosphoribosyltransferase